MLRVWGLDTVSLPPEKTKIKMNSDRTANSLPRWEGSWLLSPSFVLPFHVHVDSGDFFHKHLVGVKAASANPGLDGCFFSFLQGPDSSFWQFKLSMASFLQLSFASRSTVPGYPPFNAHLVESNDMAMPEVQRCNRLFEAWHQCSICQSRLDSGRQCDLIRCASQWSVGQACDSLRTSRRCSIQFALGRRQARIRWVVALRPCLDYWKDPAIYQMHQYFSNWMWMAMSTELFNSLLILASPRFAA